MPPMTPVSSVAALMSDLLGSSKQMQYPWSKLV